MIEKEPSQEADFIDPHKILTPQQQQINLINRNVALFRKMLNISLKASLIRLCLFLTVVVFGDQFIITNSEQNFADSWSIIFYVIASMMDFLSIINDIALLKFLSQEQVSLLKVKEDLQNRRVVSTDTKIGKYTIYLSIYDIVDQYKYHSTPSTSISQTVKYLHTVFTFYIFSHLAIYSENSYPGQIFKVAFLWLFIISVYITNFEIDLLTLQNSKGSYLQRRQQQDDRGKKSEQVVNRTIKQRYIRNCRRPFEIIYLLSIICMLSCILCYLSLSMLNIMLTICCFCHIVELIHQKHMQNSLIDLNLNDLNCKNLHCYRIMYVLRSSNYTFQIIRVATRVSIILTIMAYFRANNLSTSQHFLFILSNILLAFGQFIKFNRLSKTKLYVLAPFYKLNLNQAQCSICLLQCTSTDAVIQLPCFSEHLFHYGCMQKWFQQRKECPLCRFSLNIYQIQ